VQDGGSLPRICPQASPVWTSVAGPFLNAYFTGQAFNYTTAQLAALVAAYGTTQATAAANAYGVTEDCLFLDVQVPTSIYNNRGKGYGAPVLVWIYGGGYTAGSKTGEIFASCGPRRTLILTE